MYYNFGHAEMTINKTFQINDSELIISTDKFLFFPWSLPDWRIRDTNLTDGTDDPGTENWRLYPDIGGLTITVSPTASMEGIVGAKESNAARVQSRVRVQQLRSE